MSARTGVAASVCVALAAAGCASTATYRPIDATSRAITGQPAAYYKLNLDDQYLGNVKIWSEGGYPEKVDGKKPVIDVRMRLRNDSEQPMEIILDRSDVEIATESGVAAIIKEPLSHEGDTTVGPEGVGRIRLLYALPEGIKPGDLTGFEVNWTVRTGKGLYSDSTGFLRVRRPEGFVFWPSFYYWGGPWPYWYEPYGFGPPYP